MKTTRRDHDKPPQVNAVGVVTVPKSELDVPPAETKSVATDLPCTEGKGDMLPEHEIDRRETQAVFAVFCYEAPDSFIGRYVGQTVAAMAASGTPRPPRRCATRGGRRPLRLGAKHINGFASQN